MEATLKKYCPNSTEFETRVQSDGRELHQCTKCKRVSRTKRKHQLPGPTTASHDNTMAILWGGVVLEPAEELDALLMKVSDGTFSTPVEFIDAAADLVTQWRKAPRPEWRPTDENFYPEMEARFEERLKQLTADREWHMVSELCDAYETFLRLCPQALEAT